MIPMTGMAVRPVPAGPDPGPRQRPLLPRLRRLGRGRGRPEGDGGDRPRGGPSRRCQDERKQAGAAQAFSFHPPPISPPPTLLSPLA